MCEAIVAGIIVLAFVFRHEIAMLIVALAFRIKQ